MDRLRPAREEGRWIEEEEFRWAQSPQVQGRAMRRAGGEWTGFAGPFASRRENQPPLDRGGTGTVDRRSTRSCVARQVDREPRALRPRPGLEHQRTAVTLGDAPRCREAQARAPGACGDEWLEQPRRELGRDAGAVVDDRDPGAIAAAVDLDRDLDAG